METLVADVGSREIADVVRTIWEAVFQWDLDELPEGTPEPEMGPARTGFIQVAGVWEGAIVCVAAEELVREITSHLFHLGPADLTVELLHDALGELTNMIGGNLKALLPGPSYLCLPAVIEGSNYSICVPSARGVAETSFVSRGWPMTVKLLRGTAGGDKDRNRWS